ncbi:hypothetical protein NCG97_08855 [Streptomyces lydicamycinicus]|uniref:hypothetical protein n=1 Tax=Streptomyces lydicamycinicus TaxID=1546107 RepID=UPI00203533A6|nr:hypothetical protein [Streptomyces lydicamycinicus]USA00781.1 hypothetical protein NCG97_08855 [Streptomyces lydicamycinicus]
MTGHLSGKGLATYKLPEQLVIVDRLPTTVTGKIARARLMTIPLPPAVRSPEARSPAAQRPVAQPRQAAPAPPPAPGPQAVER